MEGRFHTLDATHASISRSNGQRSGLEAGKGIKCRPNPAATLLVTIKITTIMRKKLQNYTTWLRTIRPNDVDNNGSDVTGDSLAYHLHGYKGH